MSRIVNCTRYTAQLCIRPENLKKVFSSVPTYKLNITSLRSNDRWTQYYNFGCISRTLNNIKSFFIILLIIVCFEFVKIRIYYYCTYFGLSNCTYNFFPKRACFEKTSIKMLRELIMSYWSVRAAYKNKQNNIKV